LSVTPSKPWCEFFSDFCRLISFMSAKKSPVCTPTFILLVYAFMYRVWIDFINKIYFEWLRGMRKMHELITVKLFNYCALYFRLAHVIWAINKPICFESHQFFAIKLTDPLFVGSCIQTVMRVFFRFFAASFHPCRQKKSPVFIPTFIPLVYAFMHRLWVDFYISWIDSLASCCVSCAFCFMAAIHLTDINCYKKYDKFVDTPQTIGYNLVEA